MTDFVPSMADLFPACDRVLAQELRPMHYRELTLKALEVLGCDRDRVNMSRVMEDVREKLPMHKKLNVFYTGKPDCVMAKKWWFEEALLHADSILIPGSVTAGIEGAFEALKRSPYMQNKTYSLFSRARGFVIEKHVTNWFRGKYPGLYLEPKNHGKDRQPCNHDFRLRINNKILYVDVAGRGVLGYDGSVKRSTNLHLLCRIADDGVNVLWEGVQRGKTWNDIVIPDSTTSPQRLIVILNCHRVGINYMALRRQLS